MSWKSDIRLIGNGGGLNLKCEVTTSLQSSRLVRSTPRLSTGYVQCGKRHWTGRHHHLAASEQHVWKFHPNEDVSHYLLLAITLKHLRGTHVQDEYTYSNKGRMSHA